MRRLPIVALALALAACEGVAVRLGTPLQPGAAVPAGPSRPLTSEACGIQLVLFAPIMTNNRLQRAYRNLEVQARGDFIADVTVEETWTYAYIGTVHCTKLQARAIARA